MDLFTSPNDPVENKFIINSTLIMKDYLRNNNDKTYITVSNDPNYGQYTDLGDALDAVPDGGSIFIKKGVYSLDSKSVSDKNINIIGESAEETIIQGTTNALIFTTLSNKVSIYNLKFEDCTSESIVITNSSTVQGELIIDKCIFNNNEACNIKISKCTIVNSIFEDTTGTILYLLGSTGNFHISGNIFKDIVGVNIDFSYGIGNMLLFDNTFDNHNSYALLGYGDLVIVSNNIFIINPTNTSLYGSIKVAASTNGSCIISNNSISLNQTVTTFDSYFHAIEIALGDAKNLSVTNNQINIILKTPNGSSFRTGIYLDNKHDCVIEGNNIALKLTRVSGSTEGTGIRLNGSDRNIINSNKIEMDNHANDIGVRFTSGANNNMMDSLYTNSVGTSYINGGSGNTITNNKDL